jgi:hypothetical protein
MSSVMARAAATFLCRSVILLSCASPAASQDFDPVAELRTRVARTSLSSTTRVHLADALELAQSDACPRSVDRRGSDGPRDWVQTGGEIGGVVLPKGRAPPSPATPFHPQCALPSRAATLVLSSSES